MMVRLLLLKKTKNKLINYFLCVASIIFFNQNIIAQSGGLLTPDEFYDQKNYIQAIDGLLKLEKEYPGDIELKHRIGVCYLNIYTDKSLAIPYFQQCYAAGNYKNELLLELGKAYQFAYKFKEAISYYNKCREKASAKLIPLIDHYIETCENGIELIKKPINVSFENLGKEINTKYADYYPFVTKDEKTLFFTSRREQNTGRLRSFNGYYTSDVYNSQVVNGAWSRAKNIGVVVNTNEDEECVGISSDGKKMIIYVDNVEFPGDLFHSEILKTKLFEKPIPFNEPINTDNLEAEGCYSADGNTLFFVSNRKGGFGETDIYFSKRLPNGEWGIPKNLGSNINSIYKEAFPQITEDDMMFSVSSNNRDGYISAWRKEGMGDLDIYKIIFNNVEERQTALMGNVTLADTSKKEIDAFISIKNIKTKVELDSKNVNKITGKYLFIIPPGKYQIEITSKGNKPILENITILDKADFMPEMFKHYVLYDEHYTPPEKDIKSKPKNR